MLNYLEMAQSIYPIFGKLSKSCQFFFALKIRASKVNSAATACLNSSLQMDVTKQFHSVSALFFFILLIVESHTDFKHSPQTTISKITEKINKTNILGFTPLMIASKLGHVDCAKILAKHGAVSGK